MINAQRINGSFKWRQLSKWLNSREKERESETAWRQLTIADNASALRNEDAYPTDGRNEASNTVHFADLVSHEGKQKQQWQNCCRRSRTATRPPNINSNSSFACAA